MHYWFPAPPGWLWIVGVLGAAHRGERPQRQRFGAVEYWFSAVKITAIVLFIVLASYIVLRAPAQGAPAAVGFHNYTGSMGASFPTACGARGWP